MGALDGLPHRLLAPLGLLLSLACSGGDAADGGTADGGAADGGATADAGAARDGGRGDAGAIDPATVVGAFSVLLNVPVPASEGIEARDGFTSISGRVSSGPTPVQVLWETQSSTMGCTLMTPRVPFCPTSCGGAAACVADGVCQAYPTARSVGTVQMTGLANRESQAQLTLLAVSNTYQTPTTVQLAYPAFAEGATIGLTASGSADFPAFALEAPGVAPLDAPADPVPLRDGAPIVLTWTPPTRPQLSRVAIKLDISHHGGTKGMISCDVADTGALTIPAPMATALKALGVAGFPSVVLSRRAVRATATPAGTVQLVTASEVERPVVVDGLTSCVDDAQCPAGQTCQADLTCR